MLTTLLHPCIVLPFVLVNIGYDASSVWAQFKGKAIGIGLINSVVIETRKDGIFVESSYPQTWYKAFPYAQVVVS